MTETPMNFRTLLPLCLLALLCACAIRLPAQTSAARPFALGQVEQIDSRALGEPRTLNVYLPDGYAQQPQARFPVVYLLDGTANEDFVHIVGIYQFMNMMGMWPPSIVVGIANVDRKRDFTFPTTVPAEKEKFPTTGSSAKFIEFIEKDLQPFIESNYRTDGHRTLIGQSLGGLLATEVLLQHPHLFDRYLIVSPSLWWDGESLLRAIPGRVALLPAKPLEVYVSVGEEGKEMISYAKALYNSLKKAKQAAWKLHYNFMDDEDHATILHNSVYQGLLMMAPKAK
jgi:uncharacterized protein